MAFFGGGVLVLSRRLLLLTCRSLGGRYLNERLGRIKGAFSMTWNVLVCLVGGNLDILRGQGAMVVVTNLDPRFEISVEQTRCPKDMNQRCVAMRKYVCIHRPTKSIEGNLSHVYFKRKNTLFCRSRSKAQLRLFTPAKVNPPK